MAYFTVPSDYTGDITTQVESWIAAALTGIPAYLPALPNNAAYVMTRPLVVDMSAQPTKGVKFYGDGTARSVIDLTAITTQVPLQFVCNSMWSQDGKGDNFWLSFKDIGILANYAGAAVQFGRTDFMDPVNAPKLDFQVQNFSTDPAAIGVQLNYVLGGDMRIISNVAGSGTALDCRQAAFNRIFGSFSALGGMGIVLRDGFNSGNKFDTPDIENVFCCFRVFNDQSAGNTVIGGTWSYTSSGVFATAGNSNMIINPQANPVSPGTIAGFKGSMTGITILGGNV